MAVMIWMVLAYRRPLVAGLLLGLAAGTVLFPALALPVWLSFYWRRGMIRIWLVLSAAWIMGWVIYLIMNTAESGFRASDLLVIPVLLFGPPVALLLFGAAAGWAFKGFKMDEPPADNDR